MPVPLKGRGVGGSSIILNLKRESRRRLYTQHLSKTFHTPYSLLIIVFIGYYVFTRKVSPKAESIIHPVFFTIQSFMNIAPRPFS